MKKIIIIIVGIIGLGVAWVLISPLFINQTVNEEIPFTSEGENPSILVLPVPEESIEINDTLDFDVSVNEPMMDMKSEMSVETRGSFIGADARHQGEGELKVIRDGDTTFLRFENFSVTNGPDLFVTLNKGDDPRSEHVLVEQLKGNKGDQNYDVSEYNLDDYESVSIYCRAFSVEFATAQL